MSETHAGQLDAPFMEDERTFRWSDFISLSGLTFALSVLGFGIAGYLTYVHYDDSVLVCSASGGCHTVQESDYATIGPIPVAMLGLGMFLTLMVLSLGRVLRWTIISADTATMISWGITLSALFYYAYLVYVELFVLEAICQWCVATTALTVAIFIVESFRLRDALAIDEESLLD
jgi:uncharacterized membrane protein